MRMAQCIVSALVPRWVASRLSEAASRYGLASSDLAGAAAESLASNMDIVERVMNVYGCCDRDAWRLALNTLITSGAALYDLAEPIIKAVRGEGVLIPSTISWLEGLRGVQLRLLSLDPWLDAIDVEVGGGVRANYYFIIGTRSTVPDFEGVVKRIREVLPSRLHLEAGENEARLTYSVEVNSFEDLTPLGDVASMISKTLVAAGAEWLVAEVEHGYSAERHALLAREYYALATSVDELPEKTVDLLRSLEEYVKMLVKRTSLLDIIEEAAKTGWTSSLLDEAVDRLSGVEPLLPPAWRQALEVSISLQENSLQREAVEELEKRLELLYKKAGLV